MGPNEFDSTDARHLAVNVMSLIEAGNHAEFQFEMQLGLDQACPPVSHDKLLFFEMVSARIAKQGVALQQELFAGRDDPTGMSESTLRHPTFTKVATLKQMGLDLLRRYRTDFNRDSEGLSAPHLVDLSLFLIGGVGIRHIDSMWPQVYSDEVSRRFSPHLSPAFSFFIVERDEELVNRLRSECRERGELHLGSILTPRDALDLFKVTVNIYEKIFQLPPIHVPRQVSEASHLRTHAGRVVTVQPRQPVYNQGEHAAGFNPTGAPEGRSGETVETVFASAIKVARLAWYNCLKCSAPECVLPSPVHRRIPPDVLKYTPPPELTNDARLLSLVDLLTSTRFYCERHGVPMEITWGAEVTRTAAGTRVEHVFDADIHAADILRRLPQ
jgi:hypothetical protein